MDSHDTGRKLGSAVDRLLRLMFGLIVVGVVLAITVIVLLARIVFYQ